MSQQDFPCNSSAGSMSNVNYLNFNFDANAEQQISDTTKSPDTRLVGTKFNVERLYQLTLIRRPGEPVVTRTGGRKNKNEILGLTLARLIKEKHLNGPEYTRDIELSRGIQMRANSSGFVMVLRTDGRIVAMSDEVEHHLGKSMRSLYTQCINILQCLDKTDRAKLKAILDSSTNMIDKEHPLVCTFRLPKGKRPSRTREDITTIAMTGHFYSCHDPSSSSYEKLFIARCEALVCRTPSGSNASQPWMIDRTNDNTALMLNITLNDDMAISFVSANVKDILGYSRNEMIGNWFGRYLSMGDLEKFESIRQRYFQQEGQQTPTSVCDIFDIYGNNGDDRLTFLCQIRPVRERRAKTVKFQILAQLIDPSLREEHMKYVESGSEIDPKLIKAEQVNHVSSSVSKTSEDTIMANSPSLAMGLLMSDNTNNDDITHHHPYSPVHRSLSNVVAPVNVQDGPWDQLFDLDYSQYLPTTDLATWPIKSLEDDFIECLSGEGLEDLLNEYWMENDSCWFE